MTITPSQVRALTIIRDTPGLKPSAFAKKMWPDSECWQNSAKCGHGVHRGGGMYLAAGGYLGKLRAAGLIQIDIDKDWIKRAYLSPAGKDALQ